MRSPRELAYLPLGWVLRRRRSGERHSVLRRPGWDAPETITLTSESFEHGQAIASRHSAHGRGPNLSPQLSWAGVPEQARQLLLVFEDLDFPLDRPGLHTVGLLPPDLAGVAEGELTAAHPVIRWVPTHAGTRTGYSGPRPLPGHGTHHYWFHVIALDSAIAPETELSSVDDLDSLVNEHAIARGALSGHQRG